MEQGWELMRWVWGWKNLPKLIMYGNAIHNYMLTTNVNKTYYPSLSPSYRWIGMWAGTGLSDSNLRADVLTSMAVPIDDPGGV